MADGAVTLTVTLDDAIAARLEAAAREAGMSPEALVVGMIEDAARPGDLDAERRELARIALADYDQTGVAHPLEDVLCDVRADLNARLTATG
jgi:predicted transcriptional regulator